MSTRNHPTTRCRTPWRLLALAGLALVATLAAAAPPAAASCASCGPPTWAQIAAAPGFSLEHRNGELDYYEVSGGTCDVTLTSTPRATKTNSWLVLRGTGEVWNCPHSQSQVAVTASTQSTDSKAWSMSATAGAKLKAFGVGLEAKVTATVSRTLQLTTVTSIQQTILASYCHRIQWEGWFEVATYVADVDYSVKRLFAWWTKNRTTGATVHKKGNLWIPCGTGTADLDAQAPISGHFHLQQRPCSDPECQAVPTLNLGFFPPLGPGLEPPKDPPDDDDEEDDDAGEVVPPSSELPDPPANPDDDESDPPDDDVPSSGDLPDPPAGAGTEPTP